MFSDTLTEFEEQIASFYQRCPSRTEAEKQLQEHCAEMFGQLPQMLTILADYPVYAGIAFYGKMQVVNRKLIVSLSSSGADADAAIAAIREAKALKIAASARSGWELLLNENREALWAAIRLNVLATPPAKAPRTLEDEDDDEEDDLYDDDDGIDEDED